MKEATIVIADPGSDLGRTLLERLVRDQYNIVLLGQSVATLERLREEFGVYKANLTFHCLNWNNIEAVDQVFNEIYHDYQFIDRLVSLLDCYYLRDGEEKPIPLEIQEMINVNYLANLTLVGNVLPMMLEENRGSVVALGDRKLNSNKNFYGAAYIASKAALSTYWQELQKNCFGKQVQMTLVRFTDPTFFSTEYVEGKRKVIAKNQPSVLEQIASILEAIVNQRHIKKVSSISLG